MRFSIIAIAATLVAAVHAVEYPFAADPPCIAECLNSVGKGMFPEFTLDPKNPKFIESMGYHMNKDALSYKPFMSGAGTCMMKCTPEDQGVYRKDFAAKAEWYAKNKDAAPPASAASSVAVSGFVGAVAVLGAVALF